MSWSAAGLPPALLTPGLAQWAGTVFLTWLTAVYGPRAVRRLATPKERAEAAALAIESLSEVIERLRSENDRLEQVAARLTEQLHLVEEELRDYRASKGSGWVPPRQRGGGDEAW